MIRALRARHRALILVLAVALPLGLGLALRARREVPTGVRLPLGEHTDPAPTTVVKTCVLDFGALEFDARSWPDNRVAAYVLELTPRADPGQPDVLVYWSPVQPGDQLDPASVLLGALAGSQRRRFSLPSQAITGRLVLFSLAHQELLGSAEFSR